MNSAMVVFPKLSIDGKVTETAIEAEWIKGIQPAVLSFGGKKYNGAKVYTKAGTSFKVFGNIVNVIGGVNHAKTKGELVVINSLIALPSYTKAVAALKAGDGK
jgi:hypothetical protein